MLAKCNVKTKIPNATRGWMGAIQLNTMRRREEGKSATHDDEGEEEEEECSPI